jgi:hypothetical protein
VRPFNLATAGAAKVLDAEALVDLDLQPIVLSD